MELVPLLLKILYAAIMLVVVLTIAGYSVLIERKVSAYQHGRIGPNRTTTPFIRPIPVIGPLLTRLGIIQLPADGLKFLFKEDFTPPYVNRPFFWAAPLIAFVPSLAVIAVIPFGQYTSPLTGEMIPLVLAPMDLGVIFVLAIGSLSVYGVVLAGWGSNSKYSFLGGIRSSAQMISYELSLGLSIFPVFLWMNAPGSDAGLSLSSVVEAQNTMWFLITCPLSAFLFLVGIFAETNRLPFDMAESETDLVGGFHTEYSSFKFGLFFVGEYGAMAVGSALFVLLFLGGWNFLPFLANPWPAGWIGSVLSVLWFLVKVVGMITFFVLIRWTLPRYRFDQVMKLGWTVLLPLAIANLIVNAAAVAIHDLW